MVEELVVAPHKFDWNNPKTERMRDEENKFPPARSTFDFFKIFNLVSI